MVKRYLITGHLKREKKEYSVYLAQFEFDSKVSTSPFPVLERGMQLVFIEKNLLWNLQLTHDIYIIFHVMLHSFKVYNIIYGNV